MLAYYQVGAFLLLLLGFAFGLVWAADRVNKIALYWSISHLALGLAALGGIRPSAYESALLDFVSLLLTGLFLATMYAAILTIRGIAFDFRRILVSTTLLVVVIVVIGLGYGALTSRVFVLLVMVAFLAWAGWLFLRQLDMPWVGVAFLLRVASYLALLSNGEALFTSEHSPLTYAFSWSSAVFLGLVLIYVSVRQSRRRLDQVLNNLPDALVVQRTNGSILLCNERFSELAGAKRPSDLTGHPIPNLCIDKEQGERINFEITQSMGTGRLSDPLRMEYDIAPARGEIFPAEVICSRFMDWGTPVIVSLIRDITERKAAEQERLSLLSTDQLTGLPNRQSLELQLGSLLWEQARTHLCCAILIVALDNFKKVNDAFGHAKGDAVLRDTAKVLTDIKSERALLARIGGDEFALVMTDIDVRGQLLQVDDLAKTITGRLGQQLQHDGVSVVVGTSIGIAFSHPGDSNTNALLQRAQIAVYAAKERCRGEWCYFDDDMNSRMVAALKIESALRAAISNSELFLHYQPIFEALSGQMVKAEALARWTNPALGSVSPAIFIPIAEQSSLILDVGFWILDEAIRQAASWSLRSHKPPVVGINVSVRQFMHKDFEDRLNSAASRHGVSPSLIELEITESLFASSDDKELLEKFERLRARGYGLSLDDFGTGYSSLSYLARFRIGTVKIDRSFVSYVDQDKKKQSIVRAIISMSKSLELDVIAEGVEREEERRILIEEGCDLFQGYLFSMPVASDALPFQ